MGQRQTPLFAVLSQLSEDGNYVPVPGFYPRDIAVEFNNGVYSNAYVQPNGTAAFVVAQSRAVYTAPLDSELPKTLG